VQNHLLNDTRNVDAFAAVHGNLSNLLLFLVAPWTLAALGEELASRGFSKQVHLSVQKHGARHRGRVLLRRAALWAVVEQIIDIGERIPALSAFKDRSRGIKAAVKYA